MNAFLKISGIILLIMGIILVFKPHLFSKFPLPADGYMMIEKRVKWGLLIGFGIFLIFCSSWTSWGLTVTALLTALTIGVIAARLTGFVLDEFFVRQLYWLGLEFTVLIFLGYLYLKIKS
nr:hypothetical protein [uncultured Flavobacterium sp.]